MKKEDVTADFIKANVVVFDHSGCWEWSLRIGTTGYGLIRVNGHVERAHRLSYELFAGAIPAGLWVLHKCDNRCCVNPSHLFLGDASENNLDARNKGRAIPPPLNPLSFPCEMNPRAKLTEAEVREILALKSTKTQKEIAGQYGVSTQTIGSIQRRERWKTLQVS